MSGGIPGILEEALSTVHSAVSTIIGTTPDTAPGPSGAQHPVLTVSQLKMTGLTIEAATALGYIIVPG